MTMPDLGGEREPLQGAVDRDSLIAMSLITGSLSKAGAEAGILGQGDDLYLDTWEEEGAFDELEDEDQVLLEPIAATLLLPNESPEHSSNLRAFMMGQSIRLIGERARQLMGGFTFYSEPHPCGVGTHSGILVYKDGKVKVMHRPWATGENTDPAHTKLYETMRLISDEVEVYAEVPGELGWINSTGWGRSSVFVEAWPEIFEAATNLP